MYANKIRQNSKCQVIYVADSDRFTKYNGRRYTVERCTKKTLSVVTAQLCELNVHNCSTHTNTHLIANRHKQWEVILCFSDVWVWLSCLLLEGQAVITKRLSIFRNPFQKSDATLLLVQCGTHRVHGATEHGDHIHISCTLHTHCYRDVLSLMVVMETALQTGGCYVQVTLCTISTPWTRRSSGHQSVFDCHIHGF